MPIIEFKGKRSHLTVAKERAIKQAVAGISEIAHLADHITFITYGCNDDVEITRSDERKVNLIAFVQSDCEIALPHLKRILLAQKVCDRVVVNHISEQPD